MSEKKRIVVLISGRGSNLEALIHGPKDLAEETEQHYEIVAVISDKDALGLKIAEKNNIPTQYFLRENFSSKAEQRSAIFAAVRNYNPDLIALAGFMMIIPKEYTDEFYGKMVNIHPSLLPKFPGLDTHQRALEAQEKVHGCSVHFVDHGMDTGPLIAQASCEVQSGDTPESLAARVLKLEHRIYPWTINKIASGGISLQQTTVHYSKEAEKHLEINGFSKA